jgi:TonB family protein
VIPKRLAECCAIAAVASFPQPAPGQAEEAIPSSSTYTPARPLERRAANYPSVAATAGQEGWVNLSYVVSTDGEVTEVMIEDSSGIEHFERAAVRAASTWRYSPATLDGEPVEQSMTRMRHTFRFEDGSPGARPSFRRDVGRIQRFIQDGNLEAAQERLLNLRYNGRHNLYEDAWFWWLQYAYLEARGEPDRRQLIESLQRAIGYQDEYLPPEVFVSAAVRLYALYVQALEFSSARRVVERLRQSANTSRSELLLQTLPQLEASLVDLDSIINGPELLRVNGRVGRYDYWVYELSRREFSLDEIQGDIEVVDIRCDRGTRRYYEVGSGVTWSIPESWGDCGVYIKGTEGTTFALYEHPAEQVRVQP